MKNLRLSLVLVLSCIFSSFAIPVHSDETTVHKVAIHVDENDPATMNMALNNIANVKSHFDSIGEEVEIELVTYGPGLHMLLADTSPVKDRISVMSLEIDNLTFSACGNTHSAMSKKAGKELAMLDETAMVPQSGVVQLILLREQGYACVRPCG